MNKIFKIAILLLVLSIAYYTIHRFFFSDSNGVELDEKLEEGIFAIPEEILKRHKLSSTKLGELPEFERIILPGVVSYDLKRTARIGSRVPGRIKDIYVNQGDYVKKGQYILSIASTELGEMEARHKKSVARKKSLSVQLDRAKDLYAKKITSAKEYESTLMEFQTAKTEAENSYNALLSYGLTQGEISRILDGNTYSLNLKIRSPISGTITERQAVVGQSVSREENLFTVSNLSTVWVLLEVFEKDLNQVKVGQYAEITPMGSTETTRAKVAHVGDIIDPTTRSAEIRLELDNQSRKFRPGQSVSSTLESLNIVNDNKSPRFTLPISSVHTIEGKTFVFIRVFDNRFRAVEVEVGETIEDRIEILSGLNEEDEIITKGSFILKSEFLKI